MARVHIPRGSKWVVSGLGSGSKQTLGKKARLKVSCLSLVGPQNALPDHFVCLLGCPYLFERASISSTNEK